MPIIDSKKKMINQQLIKESNLKTLFSLIYQKGPISRTELAAMTELSPTTVFSLVDELIQSGIVISRDIGNTRNIGRKPLMLEINQNGGYFAAFSWERKSFKYLLYDLKCNIVEQHIFDASDTHNIAVIVNESMNNYTFRKIEKSKLLAICISIPAVIETGGSKKTFSSTVLGIKEDDSSILELSELFPSVPIVIGNQSIFCAYAEKEFGNLKNSKNLFYINIDEGVGAGIVFNGKIYEGSSGMAGEFGHMSIDINGTQCDCGNRGCLEQYVSISAIMDRFSQYALDRGQKPASNINELAVAYSNNEPAAVESVQETIKILAYGLCNVINLLNFDNVVLGGKIQKLGQPFLNELNKSIQGRGVKKILKRCNITLSSLDNNASCLGAVKCFIDTIFKISLNLDKNLYIY